MIEVKGLYKSFEDKAVLKDINATCLLYTSPSPRDTR